MSEANECSSYIIPCPVLDDAELASIDALKAKYEKITKPGLLNKTAKKAGQIVPTKVKELAAGVGQSISEQELYEQALKVISEGFGVVQENAAKFTISEKLIISNVNKSVSNQEITKLDEFCLARGYDLCSFVEKRKVEDLALAFAEGGVTGFAGFPGIPFNLVLSTFLYYRAVQAIAMSYGYDVKRNPDELAYASEIFLASLSPRAEKVTDATSLLGKIMLVTELEAVKQTAKKTWTDMAAREGLALLLTQMRALAHASARKALENAGKKGLEQSFFKNVFEQIGKRLTLNGIGKAVPVAGGVVGALFDTGFMNRTLVFANTVYHKRFLLEKQERINCLLASRNMDVFVDEIEYSVEETESDVVEACSVVDAELGDSHYEN